MARLYGPYRFVACVLQADMIGARRCRSKFRFPSFATSESDRLVAQRGSAPDLGIGVAFSATHDVNTREISDRQRHLSVRLTDGSPAYASAYTCCALHQACSSTGTERLYLLRIACAPQHDVIMVFGGRFQCTLSVSISAIAT